MLKVMGMFLVISCLLFFSSWATVHADPSYNPRPNPDSVVTAGQARFTVLTSRLIRMEWGQAVDSATLTFLNRYLPTPSFKNYTEGEGEHKTTVIQTDYLKLSYLPGESFSTDNLKIEYQVNGESDTWSPQPYANDSMGGNLRGTVRTLDGNDGLTNLLDCYKTTKSDSHCTLGLISRDGYAVVDDTGYPQFDDSKWPWATPPSYMYNSANSTCSDYDKETVRSCGFPTISQDDCLGRGCCWADWTVFKGIPHCYYSKQSHQDLYFFGHGHDYKGALHDFTLVAGKIPLPPRYAFGIFYSRYWAYSDTGQMEVVNGYRSRNIPLDNLVTDMDWHLTFYKENVKDPAGERKGWTGFTWDENLFPDPKGFLDWCKANNLRNTLNLHPASGIQKWEVTFNDMVKAMGLKASAEYVPWKPVNVTFVNNFFSIVLKRLQDMGVDFWWLDWQQGEEGPKTGIDIPNLNPTFWINYIFFTNPYQWGPIDERVKRPFLLHRWGGLGNHRYQIGFSGDVVPSWNSLNYQVSFTLRASNVLFGYWSHDLGGHILPSPPELYTRWIQWGAFSPIFRTHCSKNVLNDRRIWVYPLANYKIMHEFMVLRGSMVPYIYTYAREAHDTGLSLLRALYFEYPEADESYIFNNQVSCCVIKITLF
ncbi:PREDICTED: uncharacterized protein LOC105315496, partial [Amphimedon queenslandica]|uniref:P-type domain-containing protein n=1 Tax=Amphimedon queenslandica TaxID=400682 RepID=A0AAN0JXZ4_AMPQE